MSDWLERERQGMRDLHWVGPSCLVCLIALIGGIVWLVAWR